MKKFIKEKYPIFLSNKPLFTSNLSKTYNKYNNKLISNISITNGYHVKTAIEQGILCESKMENLHSYEKKAILKSIANELQLRKNELSKIICYEAGKPLQHSIIEVERSILIFELAAEESTRIFGKFYPFDISPDNKNYEGIEKRFPIGLISMISPFNFPLNLIAHKIAPAIAAGCPFILKPSPYTPLTALIMGEILSNLNLPKGAFSILPCINNEVSEPLVSDERIKMFSFTGSSEVGWKLNKISGRKKVILELGGNATCLIDQNYQSDDLIDRVIFGAFYQSGQSCISVQRVLVHESSYEKFKIKLIEKVKNLKMGDPIDKNTFIGPLISENESIKCHNLVNNSVKNGSNVVIGGNRNKNFYEPTVLENVSQDDNLIKNEIFGPICVIEKYKCFKKAIDRINESKYGLQTGIFTNDLNKCFYAFKKIKTGCVVINDVPSKRIDSMPYGGIKLSGTGKEGVISSIKEMTEKKLLLFRKTEFK